MKRLEPIQGGDRWWPEDLGTPAASGGQNGFRYAFFPDRRQLLVEANGTSTIYNSGDHRITGVQQAGCEAPVFTSDGGTLRLDALEKVG